MFYIPSIQFGFLGSGEAEDGFPCFYGLRGHSFTDQGGHVFKKENMVIEEYTGFKDQNGIEIYNGDIISCSEWMGGSRKDRVIPKAVIIFEKGAFWVSSNDTPNSLKPLLYYAVDIQVLGNIHENPELLKTKIQ